MYVYMHMYLWQKCCCDFCSDGATKSIEAKNKFARALWQRLHVCVFFLFSDVGKGAPLAMTVPRVGDAAS